LSGTQVMDIRIKDEPANRKRLSRLHGYIERMRPDSCGDRFVQLTAQLTTGRGTGKFGQIARSYNSSIPGRWDRGR
jgi:hypothetical protein